MDSSMRTGLLDQYKAGPKLLEDFLKSLPEEVWHYRPDPKRWTAHEILVHLADTEIQSHVRCRMILAEPGSIIVNHDEYQWSVALDYSRTARETALPIISLLRQANGELLENLPEEAWERSCTHTVRGTITLENWLAGYTKHLPNHIEQIRKIYEKYLRELDKSGEPRKGD